MPKFDKDVFECLIDKVVIGETLEDGTLVPMEIQVLDRFKEKNNSYER